MSLQQLVLRVRTLPKKKQKHPFAAVLEKRESVRHKTLRYFASGTLPTAGRISEEEEPKKQAESAEVRQRHEASLCVDVVEQDVFERHAPCHTLCDTT